MCEQQLTHWSESTTLIPCPSGAGLGFRRMRGPAFSPTQPWGLPRGMCGPWCPTARNDMEGWPFKFYPFWARFSPGVTAGESLGRCSAHLTQRLLPHRCHWCSRFFLSRSSHRLEGLGPAPTPAQPWGPRCMCGPWCAHDTAGSGMEDWPSYPF